MNQDLDKTDLRILYELDLNCRIAETRLAKIVGKSKEAVRYRIKNLHDRGIISGYSAHINLGLVGYRGYKAYLRVREKPSIMQKFVEHLKGRSDIYWLSIGDGAWRIGLTFLAKSNHEFYYKKNELYSKFKDLVISEVDGSLVEAVVFGKKFLISQEQVSPKPLVVFESVQNPTQIDELEGKIIDALLKNSRAKLVELAEMCDTSIEVVRNRIKRMEEKGIIQGYQANLDYHALGVEFYKAFLYFENFPQPVQKKLYELCRRHPNVVNFLKVVAPWSIELEIMAENYAHYREIINHLRHEFADSLVNVESTNLAEDYIYPARATIFKFNETKGD